MPGWCGRACASTAASPSSAPESRPLAPTGSSPPCRTTTTSGGSWPPYGGIFVAGSLAWGMAVDGFRPDRFDYLGAAICLVGVAILMYAPR